MTPRRGRSLLAGALALCTAAAHAQERAATEPLPAGATLRLGTTRFFVPHHGDELRWSDDGKRLTVLGADRGSVRFSCFEGSGPTIGSSVTPPVPAAWHGDRPPGPRAFAIELLDSPYSGLPEVTAALSADGKRLALAHYVPHTDYIGIITTTTIVELPSGRALTEITTPGLHPLFSLEGPTFTVMTFSPDGKLLAVSGDDAIVRVFDVAKGQERTRHQLHSAPVKALAFAPDEAIVFESGADRAVVLADAETGRETRRFVGHQGEVNSLTFSSDGKALASGSSDLTVLVWNVAR